MKIDNSAISSKSKLVKMINGEPNSKMIHGPGFLNTKADAAKLKQLPILQVPSPSPFSKKHRPNPDLLEIPNISSIAFNHTRMSENEESNQQNMAGLVSSSPKKY